MYSVKLSDESNKTTTNRKHPVAPVTGSRKELKRALSFGDVATGQRQNSSLSIHLMEACGASLWSPWLDINGGEGERRRRVGSSCATILVLMAGKSFGFSRRRGRK